MRSGRICSGTVLAAAVLALVTSGCGHKAPNKAEPPPTQVDVHLSVDLGSSHLPPGSDLHFVTPLQNAAADSAGSSALRLNPGYFQLVQVVTHDTVPLLLAVVPPPHTGSSVSLSERSTAVSLIYLGPFVCQTDTVAARQVLNWIEALPEVDQIAALIGSRLPQDPGYLLAGDSTLIGLVRIAQEKVLALIRGPVGVVGGSISQASVIAPATEQDGITVTELSPSGNLERFKATNRRRRWLLIDTPDGGSRLLASRGGVTNVGGYLSPPSVEFSFDVQSQSEAPVKFWGPGLSEVASLWGTFDPSEKSKVIDATALTVFADGFGPVLSTILGVGPIPDNLLWSIYTCVKSDPGFGVGLLADFEAAVNGESLRWGSIGLRTLNELAKCVVNRPELVVDILEYFGHSTLGIIIKAVAVPLKIIKLAVTVVDLGVLLHDVVVSRPLVIFTLSAEGDQTPPAAVTDLRIGSVGPTTLTLYWTAPGDNGAEGRAAQYDVRRSTSPISADNWAATVALEGEPVPAPAGRPDSLLVTGLSPNTTYYFALKTADEVPNWSALSNVSTAKTASNPQANWHKYFHWSDSDIKGKDVVITPDSGFVAVGVLSQFYATYLVRVDAAGNTLWERRYDGFQAASITASRDGGFFIGGGYPGLDDWTPPWPVIAKIYADGSMEWYKLLSRRDGTTGGHFISAMSATPEGGCYALGSYNSGADLFVARIEADGTQTWMNLVGGSQDEEPGGIATTPDGGCVVTGSTWSFMPAGYIPNWNVYVVKLSSTGAVEWEKAYLTYGPLFDEQGEDIVPLGSGDFAVAGWDTHSVVGDGFGLHATLWKIAPTGDLLWKKSLGRLGASAQSLAVTPGGHFVLAGSSEGGGLYLAETTTDGDVVADVAYTSGSACRVRPTLDGGFVVVGSLYSYARYYWSMYLQKFDLAWLESPSRL